MLLKKLSAQEVKNGSATGIIYCPYTDRDIKLAQANKEHIVPLSLGGSNQFVLLVDRLANSQLGSRIDGEIANDFLMLFKRQKFAARGHSKKLPVPLVRNAKDLNAGRQVQVTFGEKLKIWDAKDKKYVPVQGQSLQVSLQMKMDIYMQFLAKAALTAGYFVYGDLFRQSVRHSDLRTMMRGPIGLTEVELRAVKTKVFGRFGDDLTGSNKVEFDLQKLLCSSVRGSCIVFVPGKGCLGIYGGLLGEYLGMLNVPADTSSFPLIGDHDLGHAIFLIDGVLKRSSYRSRMQQLHEAINRD